MTFRVSLSSRAELQLYTNALWWAENRSTEQAIRWLDGFQRELRSLADDPHQWQPARSGVMQISRIVPDPDVSSADYEDNHKSARIPAERDLCD